MKCKYHRAELI
uniref:Uncharacterized protein n=1 Tax=Anguilla anguilla TaxID=7936 RepID=A0A0E9VLQ4_ANGAN